MLKNVVLPAPFGPIRLTIEPCGIAKSRSLTATRPPNSLRIVAATSTSPRSSATSALRSPGGLVGPAGLVERPVDRPVTSALLDLEFPATFRDQPRRAEQHHQDDDHSVDPERVLRNL